MIGWTLRVYDMTDELTRNLDESIWIKSLYEHLVLEPLESAKSSLKERYQDFGQSYVISSPTLHLIYPPNSRPYPNYLWPLICEKVLGGDAI